MITQQYNLNLIPDKVPVQVNCSQFDSLSRTIEMTIYDGTVMFDIPSGTTASVRGTKADNTGFEYPCTISGSVVSFDIQPQMTVFSGRVSCELRLINNGILGTCNFNLYVEPTPLDPNVTISETDLPLLEEAEQNAIRAEQAADRAEELLDDVVLSVDSILPDTNGNVDLSSEFNAKQNVLTAGKGIRITNDDISNTFTTLNGTNLNTLTYNFRGLILNATNYPTGVNANGVVDSIFSAGAGSTTPSHGTQIYRPYLSNDMYMRYYNTNNQTWSSWIKLADYCYCLTLTSASFSSLPQTITNANITSEHVVINSVLSNPSAQTGDWTVTTSNGSLSISGSISGSTTITLYLMRGV